MEVFDMFEKAERVKTAKHLGTAISINEANIDHYNLWDPEYPENPERFNEILKRCKELQLFERCVMLPPYKSTETEILLQHNEEFFKMFEKTKDIKDRLILEKICSDYSAIYLNQETFDVALHAVGSTISLVRAICSNSVQNGMAIIRPPGHHASKNEFSGYCLLNNVAIGAKFALENFNIKKILIVDFDVHHGQGIQRMFYDDPRLFPVDNLLVLYVSIHRYEDGKFWPHLRESHWDQIGCSNGLGFNCNIPINETKLQDADYLYMFHNVVLPLAYEYNPELVMVSAGYDAAIGCPEVCQFVTFEYTNNFLKTIQVVEDYNYLLMSTPNSKIIEKHIFKGKMELSPFAFYYMISALKNFAFGKLCAVLEGGYFLPSLAEGVACTIKALLGDPLERPRDLQFPEIKSTVIENTYNCMSMLAKNWKGFQLFPIPASEYSTFIKVVPKISILNFEPSSYGPPYDIHEEYSKNTAEMNELFSSIMNEFKKSILDFYHLIGYIHRYLQYVIFGVTEKKMPLSKVGYTYDSIMLKHTDDRSMSVENQRRLEVINDVLNEFGLLEYCTLIEGASASIEELQLIHHVDYIESIQKLSKYPKDDEGIAENWHSVYFNEHSFESASFAAGSLIKLVDKVLQRQIVSGLGLIRPPGHHAEKNAASGFCIFNNIAIATKYAIQKYSLKRIAIIDFDVHWGNGTQHSFYNNSTVLFISVHRYDNGSFYPCSKEANFNFFGDTNALGYNVNIPLNMVKGNETDYMYVFHRIILPILYEFNADLVFVSAGLDACHSDPLGKYDLPPEIFGHFINMIKNITTEQKVIVALEGGYNLNGISISMAMILRALLNLSTIPLSNIGKPSDQTKKSVQNVIEVHQVFWKYLSSHSYVDWD